MRLVLKIYFHKTNTNEQKYETKNKTNDTVQNHEINSNLLIRQLKM